MIREEALGSVSNDFAPSALTCPANVWFDTHAEMEGYSYEPCGIRMRKRKDGSTHCPTHGEMH